MKYINPENDKMLDLIAKWIFIVEESRFWRYKCKRNIKGYQINVTNIDLIAKCEKEWEILLKSLEEEEHWENGKHSGDCTKECFTCHRCLIENYYDEAREYLSEKKHKIR